MVGKPSWPKSQTSPLGCPGTEVIGMVRINGLFHLLTNGVYWGYKPLILTIDPNFLGHPSRWFKQRDLFMCELGVTSPLSSGHGSRELTIPQKGHENATQNCQAQKKPFHGVNEFFLSKKWVFFLFFFYFFRNFLWREKVFRGRCFEFFLVPQKVPFGINAFLDVVFFWVPHHDISKGFLETFKVPLSKSFRKRPFTAGLLTLDGDLVRESPQKNLNSCLGIIAHTIHVWYIYLHLVDFYGFHVGKYTSPMDAMGSKLPFQSVSNCSFHPFNCCFHLAKPRSRRWHGTKACSMCASDHLGNLEASGEQLEERMMFPSEQWSRGPHPQYGYIGDEHILSSYVSGIIS